MNPLKSHFGRKVGAAGVVGLGALIFAGSSLAATTANVPGTASISPGSLAITPVNSVNFAGTLGATDLYLVDDVASGAAAATPFDVGGVDNTAVVTDATGTGDGWDVTVDAEAPFTDGSYTINGNFQLSGSDANYADTTAPINSNVAGSTATLATDPNIAYPVVIPQDGASTADADAASIFDAAAATGEGTENLNNLYWWIHVPANTHEGTYTTTVDFAVNSGPAA